MGNDADRYRRYLDGDDNGIVEIIDIYHEGLTLQLNSIVDKHLKSGVIILLLRLSVLRYKMHLIYRNENQVVVQMKYIKRKRYESKIF